MTETARHVLIVAPEDDIHAQVVARRIADRRDVRAIVLDNHDFPQRCRLTLEWPSEGELKFHLETPEAVITHESLLGVWWRRPRRSGISAGVTDDRVRKFCADEADAAFRGWLLSLGSRVVNPIAAETAANHKAFQLAVGRSLGFPIPTTAISNDPARVRGFVESCQGDTIYKILTSTPWHITETRRLGPEEIERLDSLSLAPCIVQRRIPARCDIRATVVDEAVFAVSLHSALPPGHVDWRLDTAVEIRPHDLPAGIAEALARLVATLGLRYGAVDLRLTEDDRYCLIEVNTSGQFLFAEIHGDRPISTAMAQALCAPPCS